MHKEMKNGNKNYDAYKPSKNITYMKPERYIQYSNSVNK